MDNTEALWWDEQLKLATWPERTVDGVHYPAGMPSDGDPRRVVRDLVAVRRAQVDLASVNLARLDEGIEKAKQHYADLVAARDRHVAETNEAIADLERCTTVRDLYLATLSPVENPTNASFGAHDATINTEA